MRAIAHNKNIGEYYPTPNIFIKQVKLSRHLMIVKDGWAIDADYFLRFLLPRNAKIWVAEQEEKKLYKTDAQTFVEHSEPIFYGSHGRQYCLPRKFWEVSDHKKRPAKSTQPTLNL